MLLHKKGKLMIAKSKSSRLSYNEIVSLPLGSISSKISRYEADMSDSVVSSIMSYFRSFSEFKIIINKKQTEMSERVTWKHLRLFGLLLYMFKVVRLENMVLAVGIAAGVQIVTLLAASVVSRVKQKCILFTSL
jgi:hypothetical protein